jgi:very-short-patch-repair endonuclease
LDELKNPEDLKAKLLRHLQDPMPNRYDIDQDLLERCDSDFEREVFTKLTTMGYLTMPQVPAGDYRIDLVIEGDNDQRLAIELDGDKYHGPERWLEDWTRQKVLERVGWKFWRCWASSYTNNHEECINGLVQRLESMGIHPLEGKAKSFAYTDFRSVNTSQEKDESETLDDLDESENISVGDKVVLGLEDRKEYLNVFITENRSEPENLIFDKNHPVAVALIGRTLEDEIEINILGKHQKVCIVQLAKGKRQEGA